MNIEDLDEFFEDHEDEFLKFDRIENKRHARPDVHAFLLLDSLLPGDEDIVCGASHDEIYLNVDVEKLLEIITEDQLIELHRCGVLYDEDYDGLMMYA